MFSLSMPCPLIVVGGGGGIVTHEENISEMHWEENIPISVSIYF